MKLYLIRHGEAADRDTDPQRGLTPTGRQQARALAQLLRGLNPQLQAIWHSGKARSVETATPIAQALGGAAELVLHDGIASFAKTKPVVKEIATMDNDLAIVGHEPFLTKLASRLLAGKASAELLTLDKGGMACLERQAPDCWQLVWLLTSAMVAVAGSTSPSSAQFPPPAEET